MLTRDDVMGGRQLDDAIALGAYDIDIHYHGAGAESPRKPHAHNLEFDG